ncbi:MAG: hypothetical protein IID43_06085 [Planctomycetes bacterium]|nr:hypothetical protein [Planctomycetota bacterium]
MLVSTRCQIRQTVEGVGQETHRVVLEGRDRVVQEHYDEHNQRQDAVKREYELEADCEVRVGVGRGTNLSMGLG